MKKLKLYPNSNGTRYAFRNNTSPRHICGKVIHSTEEQAQKIAAASEKPMWAYECHQPVYHTTSKCPKCKCRDVFRDENNADIGRVYVWLETGHFPAVTSCDCGFFKLHRN